MNPSRTDDPRRGIDAQVGEDRAAICRCLKAIPTSAVPSNSRMLTAPSSPFFCKRILVPEARNTRGLLHFSYSPSSAARLCAIGRTGSFTLGKLGMVLCRTCAARLQASWRTGRSACSKDIVNSLVGSGPIRDSHVDDNDRKQQKLVHKNLFVSFQFIQKQIYYTDQ